MENLKKFTKNVAGFTVTDENFMQVVAEIRAKYGFCPALNDIVMLLVSNTGNIPYTRKDLNKAINNAIKCIGYTPAYFNKKMKEFGGEFDDEFDGEF